MGKSKTRRPKRRGSVPTGVPSIKELEESEELNMTVNFEISTVESIMEKLQSRGVEDKEIAAFAIARQAGNANFVAALIENKVIRIAAPLLVDKNLGVRHAVATCFRNVAACGDHSVSKAMVEQDVMTSLASLLQKYKDQWSPVKSLDQMQQRKKSIDTKTETFLEACSLLCSLCESSNTAVEIFNRSNLISILLPCLSIEIFGVAVPLVVAQCLHIVAEDNADAIEKLSQPLILQQLQVLMSVSAQLPEHFLLKAVAAGIMLNVYSGKLENCMPAVINSILEIVLFTLDQPIVSTLEKLSEQIISHKAEALKHSDTNDDRDLADSEKLTAVNETLKKLDHVLPAKQIALEILANVCIGNDENEEWEDFSSSDTGDDTVMDIDDFPTQSVKVGLSVPCEIHGFIVNGKLMEKVLEQILIPSDEVLQGLKEIPRGKDCLTRLSTVRCRALICINNMVQCLDIDDLGGPPRLFDLWLNLANLVFKQTDISQTEQLEAATSSMRAVLQKLAEAKCASQFSHMTVADLELLINICDQVQDSAIKVNIIRATGTLGCLLGNLPQHPSISKLINVIGSFLLEVCTKSSDLWVIAEALDAIFDVFAEDELDVIAQEISLVERLSHLLTLLKGKIKQQRKAQGSHLPIIMTAKTNLLRFIKYKNDLNKK